MRWLGRKTWATALIEALLKGRGVAPGSSFLDAFAGTATVAASMKAAGYRVATNDLMAVSAVMARATLGSRSAPTFRGLLDRPPIKRFSESEVGLAAANAVCPPEAVQGDVSIPLRVILGWLNAEAPRERGFFWRQYSSSGAAKRRFFTPENAERIDGALDVVGDWWRRGWVDLTERDVLLASLVDAADRVGNVPGVYGAFLKKWQPNAKKALLLQSPEIVPGPKAEVLREDANELVARRAFDVVYVDPPYNERQYSRNYHVLEAIAEWLDVEDREAYESSVRGKTGLLELSDRESAYCGADAAGVLADLLDNAKASHIIVSYSEEGSISCDEIARAMADACHGFDPRHDFVAVTRKRFRSGSTNDSRAYRVLEGRKRDEVAEWLFYGTKGSRRKNPGGPTLREIAKALEEAAT